MDRMAYLGFLRRKLLYITEDREPSETLLSSAAKRGRSENENRGRGHRVHGGYYHDPRCSGIRLGERSLWRCDNWI